LRSVSTISACSLVPRAKRIKSTSGATKRASPLAHLARSTRSRAALSP
jgi:hypothetical protein